MNKTFFFRFLFLLMLIGSSAQAQLSVRSFGMLENDLDARVNFPEKDQNGDVAALIKVVTTQKGFTFDGGMTGIVKTIEKPAEVWVYVPWGIKRISIFHPQLGQLRDYMIPMAVEKATVYELVLISGTVTTIVEETIESQWLVITPEPADASIYIDDAYIKRGIYQAKYKAGSYNYRVETPLYHPQIGVIQISDTKIELNVQLKPNFGYIQIASLPESEAQVLIDDKQLSTLTPVTSGALKSGEYTVKVIKDMYQPFVSNVTVSDERTTTVEAVLKPNFAELTVNAPTDASIYINNQFKAKATWKGRLPSGVFTVEARLSKHKDARQDIDLKTGDKRTLTLNPTPIYGSLDIVTYPPGAAITINGKSFGTTPNTINRLLIGDYTVHLNRQGFEPVSKTIKLTEGVNVPLSETLVADKDLTINTPTTGSNALNNQTLVSGRQVTIKSSPTGANLFINGKAVGKTPYTGILTFGNYELKLEKEGETVHKAVEVKSVGGESVFVVEIITVPTVFNPKTGRTWMDRNLGASRVATSNTDEQAYGDLYQWGRGTDGHEKRNSETISSLSRSNTPNHGKFIISGRGTKDWRSAHSNNLWQGVNGINNPCPEGFRIPTTTEWEAERDSWNYKNSAGAIASPLKLPVAGFRTYSNGSLYDVGSYGSYWSGTVDGTYAQLLFFYSAYSDIGKSNRAYGGTVRCIRD